MKSLLQENSGNPADLTELSFDEWRSPRAEATGMLPAKICIHTSLAASKVRAARMDRPEWVASHGNTALSGWPEWM